MESAGEILVLPFYGQGHLFPAMELCTHFASRSYKATLIIPSYLSSSIPDSLRQHPLIQVSEIPADASELELPPTPSLPPPQAETPAPGGRGGGQRGRRNPFERQHQQLGTGIEAFLSDRSKKPDHARPRCVVIDVMMSWSKELFDEIGVQTITFFTSGACAEAIDYACWKAAAHEMKPGETRILPGLPEDMALEYSDLDRKPRGSSHGGRGRGRGRGGRGGGGRGPPDGSERPNGPIGPGQKPKWLDELEGSVALVINTCDDLEHAFINYLATQIGKPVWGVGPLLPEEYWKSAGLLIHDGAIRSSGRQSNYTEEEVMQWLNGKPEGTVIYVSFGSEVGPTVEEYGYLASALEESNRSFIWVVQPNSGKSGPGGPILGVQTDLDDAREGAYYPHGLDKKVGDRGLIIHGWAPQLLILSHPSTGGFLSHCGWNSTVEAIGRGVPFLAWPIRGDQFSNAKLVASHLKIGYKVSSGGGSKVVNKEDITDGIEKLMGDEEVHKQAAMLREKLSHGFPATSVAALDAFADFIKQEASQ